MRRTLITSTLTGLGLLAGAGLAGAQTAPTTPNPVECVQYFQWSGHASCLLWAPVDPKGEGSFGYGSAGTGSLADLLSRVVATGSSALSLDIPIGTGSLRTPGSTGSYGPEASLGQLSATSTSGLIAASS